MTVAMVVVAGVGIWKEKSSNNNNHSSYYYCVTIIERDGSLKNSIKKVGDMALIRCS